MTFIRSMFQKSYVALALRICRFGGEVPTSPLYNTLSSSRLFSTQLDDFVPPPPPKFQGVPVYPDIHFLNKDSDDTRPSLTRNEDPNAVFVVNGSSRGIGLQFVKSLISRTKGSIVACCRNPEGASQLKEYTNSLPDVNRKRIHFVHLDMEQQESILSAGETIRRDFQRVDMLLNVAGLLGDGSTTPGPERSILKLDRDWVEKTMAVNVIGPVMFIKELVPTMKTKLRTANDRPISVVANLSARVGSISDNELGGWYSYRFSKAALNQATRTLSHELKRQGTWTIALHPGTTDTDLSKPFQRNVADGKLFPVEFTVKQLLNIVDSMTEENSGGLYDWAGKALPF